MTFRIIVILSIFILAGCASGPIRDGSGRSEKVSIVDECFSLVNSGNYQNAIEICDQATIANPESFIAQTSYAKALAETGQIDLAEEHYRRALEIDPSVLNSRMELALLLKNSGMYGAALTEFQEVIRQQENFTQAIVETARTLVLMKNWTQAVDMFDRAILLQPEDEYLRIDLVKSLMKSGKISKSRKVMAKASQDFPHSGSMHFSFATLLQEQKLYREAISEYSKTLAIDSGNDSAQYNIAVCYYQDGQIQKAKRSINTYLNSHQGSSSANLLAGQIAFESGNLTEAESLFRKAIHADKTNGSAWVMLGNVLNKSGDKDGSKEAYRQALRINPNDAIAKKNLKRLY